MFCSAAHASDPLDYVQLITISDGNIATNDDGWANSHINAVPFKRQSLTTVSDYQFTSYYDADGKLIVARRNLAASPDTWTLSRTQFTSRDINDAHNTSSIAIDGDGFLHVAWGVHGNPLLYSRSTTSVLNDNPFQLVGGSAGNSGSISGVLPFQSSGVTYPELTNIPGSGDLLINYRVGSSGDGEWQLARWDNQNDVWTSIHSAVNSGNTGAQPWFDDDYSGDSLPNTNAYPNGLVFDSSGRLHISWTWRTGGDSPSGFSDYQTNHNVMYAYSDNQGIDWYRDNGAIYQRDGVHDIDENNAVPVIHIPEGSSLINATSSAIGGNDHYYMSTYWAPEASQGNHLRQIMLVAYDGVEWKTHQVSQRDSEYGNNRIPESQLRNYPLRRPVVLADEQDRVLVVYGDYQRGGGVTVAYSELPTRDDWTTIDLTTEDLGTWSPTVDLNRWQNDGVLSVYYQPTGLGQASTPVSVLEWDARAYFQSSPQPENRLILTINHETNSVSITNPASVPIEIDGFTITSSIGAINAANFAGLGEGWSTASVSANRITQLRETGTSAFTENSPISVGAIFNPPTPSEFGVGSPLGGFTFLYTQPGYNQVLGDVRYEGDMRENNLVLTIDENGMATIQNESYLSVAIEGYTITSNDGLLDIVNWTSLDQQDAENGSWVESITSNGYRVTELMIDGVTDFTPLKGFSLGKLYDETGAGSIEDLTFQFLIAGQTTPFTGVVVFGDLPDLSSATDGDFDGDGNVDAADYVVWRKTLGDTPSYNTWKANFAGSSGQGVSSVVPEAGTMLQVLWLFVIGLFRLRRSAVYERSVHSIGEPAKVESGHVGKNRNDRRPHGLGMSDIATGTCIQIISGIAITTIALLLTRSAYGKVVASDSFEYSESKLTNQAGGFGWAEGGWKSPPGDTQYLCDDVLTFSMADEVLGGGRSVAIHGTGDRNNPLRRELQSPYSADEVFVRFLLRYEAASIDNPGEHGDGEFFVIWLDDIDGGDGAGHNPNVPNIGINAEPAEDERMSGRNVFMARIGSENTGPSDVEVVGDRTYLIVARISKTQPGPLSNFDHLELWVDPDGKTSRPPDATAFGRGSNLIRWIGFSTGKKTEVSDFVLIDDLVIGERWEDVLPGTSPQLEVDANDERIAAADKIVFRHDVYPILQENCFACHQGHDSEAGFRLDLRDELLGHYQGHPLVVPGDSNASPLYQVLITEDEAARMPLGSDRLSDSDIDVVRRWIDQGLDWDENLLPSKPPESDHWAFQKIKRPSVPSVSKLEQVQNPVDAFIVAQRREAGLSSAPPADRRTLFRRLSLIYTGLPPTSDELDDFMADDSVHAYRRALDRFLASAHYGERWGRYWLDLARWAESDGYQHDEKRSKAWRYRDYVIQSFANNKSYDRFIREQIAGDEMQPYEDENLTATGFLAAGRYSGNELDKVVQRNDILVDIANTTGSAILGLTIHCAQCHTHKFDPITARDYYSFAGFFVQGQPGELLLRGDSTPEEYAQVLSAVDEQYRILETVRAKLETKKRIAGQPVFVLTRDLLSGMSPAQRERFGELQQITDRFERIWGYYSPVTSPTAVALPYHQVTSPLNYSPSMLERMRPVLLIRGDIQSPGPEVAAAWPAVFESRTDEHIKNRRRSDLVDWLFDRNNPLTARVWVNRIWQYHFGKGIVTTPDDFGTQGAPPSHPELLDWLAVELIESGWDTAHVQRLIAESATFQQSSHFDPHAAEIDPENQFYWRWSPRRLEAEAIRDAMLTASGLLDRTVGGPSVPINQRDQSNRRTLYLEQKRGDLPYVQQLFDAPSTLTCSGHRLTSTVPLQPLFLLNDPQIYRYAQALAARVINEVGEDEQQRAERAFHIVLGRFPNEREVGLIHTFLNAPTDDEAGGAANRATDAASPPPRFVQYCHALLNLNELFYIP